MEGWTIRAWAQAPASARFVALGVLEQKEPPAETWCKILAAPDAVYVGIYCAEPQMDKLADTPIPFDGPIWERDCVEVFLDPSGHGTQYYQFMISAGNDRFDNCFIEGGQTTVGHYSGLWESAVYKGKDFWSAEVKIPLSCLYYSDAADFKDSWLLNVARERKPKFEYATWAPLKKGFHEAAGFLHVSGMPKKSARYDLRVTNMTAQLLGTDQGRYRGTLQLDTSIGKAAPRALKLSLDEAISGAAILSERAVTLSPGTGTVMIPEVTFPSLGNVLVKAVLRDDAGETVSGLFFPLRLAYAPLDVDVTEPCYARCFFPGQPVKQITGSVQVNLPPAVLHGATLRVALDGGPARLLPIQGARAPFTIDASGLREGEHTLLFSLDAGKPGHTENSVTIRRLAQPAKGSCVYFDRDLNLVVNGKPLFVRGWYGDENYLVSTALLHTMRHPDSPAVNAWHCQAGMEAERLDPADAQRAKQDVKPSPKVFDEMRRVCQENKDNPALYWYYLCDEPECRGISPVYLKYQYDFIKALDPYHPVMIITRAPELFTACADILSPHVYTNPHFEADGRRAMLSPKEIRKAIQQVYSAGNGASRPGIPRRPSLTGSPTGARITPPSMSTAAWSSPHWPTGAKASLRSFIAITSIRRICASGARIFMRRWRGWTTSCSRRRR